MLWPVNLGVSPSFFLASLAGKKVLLIQLGITPRLPGRSGRGLNNPPLETVCLYMDEMITDDLHNIGIFKLLN